MYFQPTTEFCQKSPLSPNIHPLAQDNSILDRLVKSCHQKGIKPKSWTVYLHNSFLGTSYHDCAQQNVYGDYYNYGLCPANPQVRAYAIALSQELENRGIEIIEIESLSYMGFGHSHYHSKFGVDFGSAKTLIDLCFCSSRGNILGGKYFRESASGNIILKKVRERYFRGKSILWKSTFP